MEKSKVASMVIGTVFVIMGLVFLMTLVDMVDSEAVYRTLLPVVLIGGGIGVVSSKGGSKNAGLGLGLMTIGTVTLLVRFDLLRGDVVNAVVGIVLLISGVMIMTMLADRWSTDTRLDSDKNNKN